MSSTDINRKVVHEVAGLLWRDPDLKERVTVNAPTPEFLETQIVVQRPDGSTVSAFNNNDTLECHLDDGSYFEIPTTDAQTMTSRLLSVLRSAASGKL